MSFDPSRIKYLCVLDFEATCEDKSNIHEIIEFPSIIVDVTNKQILEDRIDLYVKPSRDPIVSKFCHELTGITQEQVDAGISFPEAVKQHFRFIKKYYPFIIITCGNWDLKIMFPIELKNHKNNIKKVDISAYKRWINIKSEFDRFYKVQARGMVGMLNYLNLPLEGRHHSGIDDCYNISRICVKMLEDGWQIENAQIETN